MANEYDKLLAPAASDNPYDAMLGSERKQTMRVNMMTGVDANPDTEARVQDFARRYNLPAEAVRLELPQIERRAKVEALDYDTLARMPATAKLLENPDKARLVHDDVTNLQATEDLFWQRYATGQASRGKIDGPAYQRGDWQAPQPTATARAASFVANTGSAMASSVPKFNEGAWGLLRAGGDLLPDAVGDPVAGFAARMGGVSRGQGDRLMPKASGLVEASWYSGMQSFGLNMLQLPLAFASGGGSVGAQMAPRMSPMLASMGLTTGGQAYGEARDKGVGVGQSLAFGASQGVIEAGTEMIGMPALFSLLKPGKFATKALEYMLKEQGGEQIATHLQDLNEWAVLNPEKSFADYLIERPNAALQTALSVVFGGGAQVATMKGVGWAMNRAEHQQYKAQQAEASAALMGQLNELAKASKVLQRDPATFEEFIAEASAESPVNTVYIDGQSLMQSGMGEMLMQVSPSVAAQLPEAAQTGGTVAIPVSEYAARIAPTEHAQGLQDLIRTEPDGFSRAEAQDYMATHGEQLQQDFERAATEAENADAFRASADAVRETIKTQLTQAGVFREAVNDAYAAVPASFYAVTAAKLGMTPEALFQRYPLKIAAERIDGPQFEQSALRDVDVFGNGSRVDHYDDKKGLMYSAQRFPGGIRWTVFETFPAEEGGNQVLGDMFKYKSLEEAQAAVRGLRISATQKATNAAKYGAIPNLWKGEEKKVAKALIDAGVGIERFASSTQSRSKYLYLNSGLKVRIADHALPGTYDQPDVDYRYGGDIKALVEEVVGAQLPTDAAALSQGEGLDALRAQWDAASLDHAVSEANGIITLSKIVVPESARGAGAGTQAMQALVDYADRTGQHIALTPSAEFGGNAKRLVGFYKRFGFVENKGRNRAFTTSESMYRPASGKVLYQSGQAPDSVDAEVQRQLAETERAYGGRAAYDKAKAAGRTKLTFGQWVQVRTPNFKRWFGDWEAGKAGASEVVDPATGEPLVVYHGSQAQFSTFDKSKQDYASGDSEGAFWFTSDRGVTEQFGGNVIAAHLSVQKLFEVDAKNLRQYFPPFGAIAPAVVVVDGKAKVVDINGEVFVDGKDRNVFDLLESGRAHPVMESRARKRVMAAAKKAGANGVVFRGFYDASDNASDIYAVFEPTQVKSATGNNGQFDPNDPNILHQGPRGAYSPAAINITILKGADLSTFLHEAGHHFLEMQLNLSAQLAAKPTLTEGEQSLVNDSNSLLQWFGVRDIAEWQNMPFEERRAHHETFARGFEAYLYEGKAPSIELQGLFQRFRAWLLDVYKALKNLNVELTPDVRGVMDRMLATTDEIVMAEQARGMMLSFETAEQAGITQAEWAEFQQQHTQATQDAVQDLQARGLRDMQWLANARGREVARLKRESAALRKQAEMQARRELMNEPVYRAWAFLTGKITEEDRLPKPPAPPKTGTALNPEVDSLLPAIAKLGGIARASAGEHLGVHKDDFRVKSGVFGSTVFRAEGGLSADAMAERLVEQGYLMPDEHGKADLQQLEEKIGAELIGDNQYSVHHDWANAYGEMRAGEQAANLEQLGAGRLDVGALQDMYGKSGGENVDWARLTERRMTSDNGLHPDIVADLLTDEAGGPLFSSGDHLVHALLEAQPLPEAVRELTDAIMLQEHGELATPEAIAEAADAAIHNAARARFVATEANALAKATGQPKVLNEAARAYAEQAIARHKLRDLKPSRYTNAETKAAKASAKAMDAGDLAVAAAEKRNQVIQNHLARAAHQAREQGAKDARYLRKFDKRSPTLDAEYADQIDALLDRYDLSDRSLRAIDRAKSLRQWYEEQVARGIEPDIPQSLLDEAGRKSWKDMTVEEFRGVVDTVRQIEHLGRLKHRLLTAQDKRAFDAIATDVAQTIRDNGGAVRQQPLERERGLGGMVRQFRADHRKFASLLRQMDGSQDNGVLWNLLGREMNDRGTQEAVANERATEALMALYKPMLKLKGGLMGEKVFIPAIGDSLTRGGRLAVALNWGNADNRQRLMSGRGWNEAQVSAVLGTLSREELGFVNGVWEYLDSFWPEIAAKEKRLTGVEPERVQAAPFTLALADGSQVDMRGGYYPIKYDPTQSDRAAAQDAAQIADEMKRGAFTRATTRRGHTKARTAEVKGRPLLLDLSVITQHVSQVNHDLAWHEWLVDANRLLADRRITSAIRDHYGHETLATMKDHLEAIATGDLQTQDAIDRAMLYLRGAVSRSTMGLSLTTALMQPFGITQSMVRVGPKWVIQGMGRWVGDAARFESSMTWISEKSDFMRLRNKTFNRELSEINGRVTHGKGKLRTMADASLFYLMQKMQLVADVPTWIGAFEKAQAAGHDEAKSVALADQAVIDSQGGGQTKDLSAVQRKHPFLAMFYSYFSATYNLAAESTAKTDFRNPAQAAGWLTDMALLMVIPALAPNLLMALLRGEGGDDEWWDDLPKTLAKWQAGYLLSTMVGVREISGLIEGFAYSGPPAGRVLVDAGKLVTQVKQGEVDEGLAAASVRLLGSTTGIPSTQIVRSARGWSAWADGEAPVTSVLVGPPPPNR